MNFIAAVTIQKLIWTSRVFFFLIILYTSGTSCKVLTAIVQRLEDFPVSDSAPCGQTRCVFVTVVHIHSEPACLFTCLLISPW